MSATDPPDRIVEKPAPEDAPSRMGVAGRYILTPRRV
jgi:UTP--glucose-1-phosphate uridylyltransferase